MTELVLRARDIKMKWHGLSLQGKLASNKEKDKNMLPQVKTHAIREIYKVHGEKKTVKSARGN